MFVPIYLLPQYSASDRNKYESRWQDLGSSIREKILKMMRNGAGEDFLQSEFEHGSLNILENYQDLRGVDIFSEKITFPNDQDTFENIDFSYASFYHSEFKYATFFGSYFGFAKLYNVKFINCNFSFTNFYGAELEKVEFINCDFLEEVGITNCNFKDVKFEKCFAAKRLFFDCKLDEKVIVDNFSAKANNTNKIIRDNKDLAEIFKGIKEGYRAGEVNEKVRQYFLREKRAINNYNTKRYKQIINFVLLDLLTNYGTNPLRTLMIMLFVFASISFIFTIKMGLYNGILMAAGAFFTFGANVQLLDKMNVFYMVVYVMSAFLGISLMALFITVLVNFWFGEK